MSEQSKYWTEMVNLKRDAYYIGLFAEETEKIDRTIDVIKAVAASGALGAWAIFQVLPILWGSIIAFAQFLSAVKEFLPYKKRLKSLTGLSLELGTLAITAESDWYYVSNGSWDDEKIHKLRMTLKRKQFEAIKSHFGGGHLTSRPKLVAIADTATEAYFSSYQSNGQEGDSDG